MDEEEEYIEDTEQLSDLLDSAGITGSKGKNPKVEAREFPSKLPILPLVKRTFCPGMAVPFVIEQGHYYDMLKEIAKLENRMIGLFLTKEEDCDIYKLDFNDIYNTGVAARVLRIIPIENNGAQVIFNIERRIKISKQVKSARGKHLVAEVKYFEDKVPKAKKKVIQAYSTKVVQVIKEILKYNPLFKDELQIFLSHIDFAEAGRMADFAAALTMATREEQQKMIEAVDIEKRINQALVLLNKELDICRLNSSISQTLETSISASQREYFLREQLKAIKKELGMEKDDKQCDIEKFRARLEEREVPKDVFDVINEEFEKLNFLDVQSAEYSVCRNYLDWLTCLPWGLRSEENTELSHAVNVLNKDHYGLEDVKDRILEFISVGNMVGHMKGQIICLVGPPGVGKTSVGKSIARALNREFYRFSVGGMRDEAEIKGHRRTYVGAMPGKIIQAIKQTKSCNPVIMLDEVDKMGASYQGDPASALLEVLDPEQNKSFLDHFLDVRFDLSEVLFIVTCNMLDTIPGPLLDRMEVLRLSGYITEEKIQIAKNYLVPRNRKEMGLTSKEVSFKKDALVKIANDYCREAGVRGFEKQIKKIMRKIALEIVRKREEKKSKRKSTQSVQIDKAKVEHYLGKPIFTDEPFHSEDRPGVVPGLAYTAYGGAMLYIEVVQNKGKERGVKITGNTQDIMKESSQIAWTYALSEAQHFAPGSDEFDQSQVHIHVPDGATPKDGPSAGITMATALFSLLKKQPIKSQLAMTGEITLTGKVLPIGGLKEKLIAAKRRHIKELIVPRENQRDYDELPDHLKKGLKVHFVDEYEEVYKLAFGSKKREKASKGRASASVAKKASPSKRTRRKGI